jgi:hypothetical protein
MVFIQERRTYIRLLETSWKSQKFTLLKTASFPRLQGGEPGKYKNALWSELRLHHKADPEVSLPGIRKTSEVFFAVHS